MAIKRFVETKQDGDKTIWICNNCNWEVKLEDMIEDNGDHNCPQCGNLLGRDL